MTLVSSAHRLEPRAKPCHKGSRLCTIFGAKVFMVEQGDAAILDRGNCDGNVRSARNG